VNISGSSEPKSFRALRKAQSRSTTKKGTAGLLIREMSGEASLEDQGLRAGN
jgi:hypothetical protein